MYVRSEIPTVPCRSVMHTDTHARRMPVSHLQGWRQKLLPTEGSPRKSGRQEHGGDQGRAGTSYSIAVWSRFVWCSIGIASTPLRVGSRVTTPPCHTGCTYWRQRLGRLSYHTDLSVGTDAGLCRPRTNRKAKRQSYARRRSRKKWPPSVPDHRWSRQRIPSEHPFAINHNYTVASWRVGLIHSETEGEREREQETRKSERD